MSFLFLRDEYSISREKTAKWNIFGAGVSNEFTYLENIFLGVSKEWTFLWDIRGYVSKEFTYLWSIGYYISREFNYLWQIGLGFGGKAKYSFLKAKTATRFFKRDRLG
jgi:hypothetical protein